MTHNENDLNTIWQQSRETSIEYIRSLQQDKPWLLTVSKLAKKPIAIGSATAVLLLNFLDELNNIPADVRKDWCAYLMSFMKEDGMFEDKVDMSEGTQGYPYWALRAHRTRHIAWAVESLGGKLTRQVEFVEPLLKPGKAADWVREIWEQNKDKIWSLGNWIMDVGVLLDLQYRHMNAPKALNAINEILDVLTDLQEPNTGYWLTEKNDLRRAMAGAMHWYPLYWAYGREIKHFDRAVSNTLKLQQQDGLFGFESGSGGCQCLDYDAMLIICNGYTLLPNMCLEITNSAIRVLDSIMINQNPDGSFADSQTSEIRYWATKAAIYNAKGGSLWDTYARLMTIAMCMKIVGGKSPEPMIAEHHLFEIFNGGRGWTKGSCDI